MPAHVHFNQYLIGDIDCIESEKKKKKLIVKIFSYKKINNKPKSNSIMKTSSRSLLLSKLKTLFVKI